MKYNILIFMISALTACISANTPSRDFAPLYIKGPKLPVGHTIDMIDGSFLDGAKFHNMMKLRTALNERRFGIKTNSGLTGFYEYNGSKYSLDAIVSLEKNGTNPQSRQEFYNFLQQVIVPDFLKLTEPFLGDATGKKLIIMELMKEWAHKAGRPHSLLLAWGASREGHESDVVRNQAKTIEEFDQFCADLVYYLETLMRSCKVAAQQYKEFLKQLAQNNPK